MADDHPRRVGVMLVGLSGGTANTSVASCFAHDMSNGTLGSLISGLGIEQYADLIRQDGLVFGGWDTDGRSSYEVAIAHGILPRQLVEAIREPLDAVRPLAPVIGPYDTDEALSRSQAYHSDDEAIQVVAESIRDFRLRHMLDNCIVVYLGPPLRTVPRCPGLLPSAAWYALGAINAGAAFIDFTPNETLRMSDVVTAAEHANVPLAGRDGNTGQTFLKIVLASMFSVRNLSVKGWYSTNILGNNDGAVLSRPEHREVKMSDKRDVLPAILGYEPDHVVDISFYGPRGDDKESWDVVDFEGLFGLPMSLRLNWHGRDSILAAPLVIDLVRHLEYTLRHGQGGLQRHLSIYFKRPLPGGVLPLDAAVNALTAYYNNE